LRWGVPAEDDEAGAHSAVVLFERRRDRLSMVERDASRGELGKELSARVEDGLIGVAFFPTPKSRRTRRSASHRASTGSTRSWRCRCHIGPFPSRRSSRSTRPRAAPVHSPVRADATAAPDVPSPSGVFTRYCSSLASQTYREGDPCSKCVRNARGADLRCRTRRTHPSAATSAHSALIAPRRWMVCVRTAPVSLSRAPDGLPQAAHSKSLSRSRHQTPCLVKGLKISGGIDVSEV
jgi:hypothetical protein